MDHSRGSKKMKSASTDMTDMVDDEFVHGLGLCPIYSNGVIIDFVSIETVDFDDELLDSKMLRSIEYAFQENSLSLITDIESKKTRAARHRK
jgi:hypothetical protein